MLHIKRYTFLQEFSPHIANLHKVTVHTRIPIVTIYGHDCPMECRLFNVWILDHWFII
jgi:hypothetical protein